MKPILLLGVLCTGLLAFASCRGGTSDKPPVHLVLDMDFQPKVKAQSKSAFAGFADGRGMRLPVAGTVARGSLPDADLGNRDASNAFVTRNPVALTDELLRRGRELYDIHCAICHGYSGRGSTMPFDPNAHGLVGRRWPLAIPNFHFVEGRDNRVAELPDGEYFEVITNGKGTMPAYGPRIDPKDRWLIVHYIRVLQSLSR